MAQLERPQRQLETTAKAPPAIHTMEQLLRGNRFLTKNYDFSYHNVLPCTSTQGESSKSSKNSPTCSSSPSSNLSSPGSPFFQRLRSSHDSEDDHSQNPKKSVLTKVKEKAKKLRHSLSKKKHEDGNLSSPSSATAAEGDGAEEDAEFLGAPSNIHLYESEKTPTGYKANVKQIPSPRANPMIPEKHVVSSSDKHVVEQDHERSLYRSLSKRTTHPATTITATTPNATTASVTNINVNTHPSTPSPLNKTTTETAAPKLSTVQTEKPDAAHATSKVQGLTVSKPSELHDHPSPSSPSSPSSSSPATFAPKSSRSNLSYSAPRTPLARVATSQFPTTTPRTTSAPITSALSAAPSLSGKNTSPTAQIWDKGVSMKEYFLNKLEPGEDEKALSQVISEAMSPRRTPGDAGVMEKVREAVTSLLRTEEPAKYADASNVATPSTTRLSPQSPVSINASRSSSLMPSYSNASRASSQMPASTSVSRTSSQVPISYNAQQDYTEAQEENHGRILQAN
ncbi:uncharacterized protein HKW66_Vig0140240 [Vigna angularis]|uniref:LTI65/LTI78 PGEED repeat domain-containing protein n=1 Tax=Phaseolus angularis TaxID=3914 RepID=A0A8T0KD24_PHAAN|nr:uncharacterized protein HKW66_Vig0140240 [Vigna angularis]